MDLDSASRWVLAAVSLLSAASAFGLAIVTHPRYTPHMILVGFWSAWLAVSMIHLALPDRFDVPYGNADLIVANRNGAATVVIGGWAILGLRLWFEAARARSAIAGNIEQ